MFPDALRELVSADTRVHVATTTVEKMLDYVLNTPEDGLRSAACLGQRMRLIERNLALLAGTDDPLLRSAR